MQAFSYDLIGEALDVGDSGRQGLLARGDWGCRGHRGRNGVDGAEAGVAAADEFEVAVEDSVFVEIAGGDDLGGETMVGAEEGEGNGGGEELGVGGGWKSWVAFRE